MNSRNHTNSVKARLRAADIGCSNIPIECIRKTRCLNVDKSSACVSRQVYKIMKSNNGRKIFT